MPGISLQDDQSGKTAGQMFLVICHKRQLNAVNNTNLLKFVIIIIIHCPDMIRSSKATVLYTNSIIDHLQKN